MRSSALLLLPIQGRISSAALLPIMPSLLVVVPGWVATQHHNQLTKPHNNKPEKS
jgi:hypothetical protein